MSLKNASPSSSISKLFISTTDTRIFCQLLYYFCVICSAFVLCVFCISVFLGLISSLFWSHFKSILVSKNLTIMAELSSFSDSGTHCTQSTYTKYQASSLLHQINCYNTFLILVSHLALLYIILACPSSPPLSSNKQNSECPPSPPPSAVSSC